jgi:hypothetical protein
LHIVPFCLFLPAYSIVMPPKTAPPPAPASNQASADSEVVEAGRSGEASDKMPAAASGGAEGESFGSAEQALSDAVFSLIGLPFDQLEAQLQGLK